MAVIKALEKTYMLKSVGTPEYCIRGNADFLGEAWKNQGLGLTLLSKTYTLIIIPKFGGLLAKSLSPSRHVEILSFFRTDPEAYNDKNRNI
jgi:hypothetical protein